MAVIPIVDLFAGPGGLNEGFSSLKQPNGDILFETVASFEMNPTACSTLRLRSALRFLRRLDGSYPDSYYSFLRGEQAYEAFAEDSDVRVALKETQREVQEFELGASTRERSDQLIRDALRASDSAPWVLIGGPPCQAYSLAGRSRRTNDVTFKNDSRHTLYREYLHIIGTFRPAVFVMENVKGMLSSEHAGGRIFEKIREDLARPHLGLEYDVRSFVVDGHDESLMPKDYIIRAENYGIPQRRHRVILLGIRKDLGLRNPRTLLRRSETTVHDAIGDMPRIRSGISPRATNSEVEWLKAQQIARILAGKKDLKRHSVPSMGRSFDARYLPKLAGVLRAWLHDERLGGVVQHESRFHMSTDLQRYAFLAYEAAAGRTRRVDELPDSLVPAHKNARNDTVPFADRFRVQRSGAPSSTVVSHIAKDGHYYIHPDPRQMRSLTVREAARLQTFPDNYFFMGSRTEQYHQVGNAVPPLLARQLAEVVAEVLGFDVHDTDV